MNPSILRSNSSVLWPVIYDRSTVQHVQVYNQSGRLFKTVNNLLVRPCVTKYGHCLIHVVKCILHIIDNFLSHGQRPTNENIYVMYHGTTYEAAKRIIKHGFKRSKEGMLGKGVYVSRDVNKAMQFPVGVQWGKVVLKLRVNVGKVKIINHHGHPMQKTWHDHGYDTAWVPPNCGMTPRGMEEDCVWKPKRIKVVGIAWANPPNLVHELEELLHCH